MLCTLYSNANILICARTLGSFLILFKAPFGFIIISLFNSFFGSFDCFLHSLKVILFCLQLLIHNIVWFPPTILIWLCSCVFTLFFEYAHFFCGGTLSFGFLLFPPILAIDANGGEVSRV